MSRSNRGNSTPSSLIRDFEKREKVVFQIRIGCLNRFKSKRWLIESKFYPLIQWIHSLGFSRLVRGFPFQLIYITSSTTICHQLEESNQGRKLDLILLYLAPCEMNKIFQKVLSFLNVWEPPRLAVNLRKTTNRSERCAKAPMNSFSSFPVSCFRV